MHPRPDPHSRFLVTARAFAHRGGPWHFRGGSVLNSVSVEVGGSAVVRIVSTEDAVGAEEAC